MTEERKRRKAGKCGRVFRRSDAVDTLHETNRIKGLNGKEYLSGTKVNLRWRKINADIHFFFEMTFAQLQQA